MDRNLLLAFALSFLVLVLWTMWQGEPRPRRQLPPGEEAADAGSGAARGEQEARPLPPIGDTARGSAPPAAGLPPPPTTPATPGPPPERFQIETPRYTAELTSRGAALRHWELVEYRTKRKGGEPIVLTTGEPPWDVALLTPFEELGLGDLSTAPFELESRDGTSFVFRLEREGVVIRKSFAFEEQSYTFRLRIEVVNISAPTVAPRFGVYWPAHVQPGTDFNELSLVVLQDAEVAREPLRGIGTPGFLGMSAAQSVYDYPGTVEWAGADTTYFLSVLLPDNPAQADARLLAVEPGKAALAELSFAPVQIPRGRSAAREYRGYVGPKETDRLTALGGNTERSIDLGWSWVAPMTAFFGWTLRALHSIIPNYGVAIIVLTILVRVVTAPLTTKQMRSMERMRALQPKLKAIQEKYSDDRQKQSEETMRLYRQEKVNPLGGCFPMLLQLPVFIGLFYALRSSIELRQAPFVAWIDDLSAPETLFTIPGIGIPVRVLPLIMGGTMVLQQRMTPMPSMDPMQARMMTTIMPIMMTVVFYQFPSGLVLYWMVSNVLAIAHQRWIGRKMATA